MRGSNFQALAVGRIQRLVRTSRVDPGRTQHSSIRLPAVAGTAIQRSTRARRRSVIPEDCFVFV